MIKKFLDFGNKYVLDKMEDPNSMLYKMVKTSNNLEESTDIVKKIYMVLYGFLIIGILNQALALWFLRSSFIPFMPVLLLVGIIASVLLFVYSTNFEYFNFWNRKKRNIFVIVFYMALTAVAVMALVFCEVILPIIFLIPIGPDVTMGMVVWLSRLIYAIAIALPAAFIIRELYLAINQPETWGEIDSFKIRKYIDFRKDKEFKYDLNIIKKMEDGSHYTVKEKDRQLHIILNGVTGVGKTSAAFIPAITSDLDQKVYNEDYLKKELVKRMLSNDDVHPHKDMTDETFSIDSFWADNEEAQAFMEELKQKAPSAGITVVAPNAALADAVYELATIRGFKAINRIDPIPMNRDTGEMKPGFVGFNPLYISNSLSPFQRKLEVFNKSRMFSDVLQALYEQSGKSDPYFTSLNRNMTTMIAILVIVTYPYLHDGEQPDMTAVQEVINDFSEVRKYLFALAKMEGLARDIRDESGVTYEWLRGKKFGEYQFIVSQIAIDLLGPGRTKMEDQARGLRTIINEFLTDPLVKNLICSKNTVDIDRILEKGEITILNYGLELGTSIATGLGQFFMLSLNQAVLRRPGDEDSRLLHLVYCDELPVLIHKDMESIYSLWRQFKACSFAAFQTTAQFEKNETTRYLKNVIISNVGHHIVYGRCSAEEMNMYQDLAGKKLEFMEQQTVSEKALTDSDTSMSFSTRVTPQYVNAVEGYKIRNKDFQEVTIFGVNNGDHVPPFDGKLSFLTKEQKEGKGRCQIDWERFKQEEEHENVELTKTAERIVYRTVDDVQELLEMSGLNYLQNQDKENPPAEENIEPQNAEEEIPVQEDDEDEVW